MNPYTLLLIPALLGAPASADEILEAARKAYDFRAWPGKQGLLKQGLDLRSVDLSPFAIGTVRTRLSPQGCTRIFRYHRNDAHQTKRPRPIFEISLQVLDTVAGAHEGLLEILSLCQARMPAGGSLGIHVGDVSFATRKDGAFKMIVFARNNILVSVYRFPVPRPRGKANHADIASIAGTIDRRLLRVGDTVCMQGLARPVIRTFQAEETTIQADTPVLLALEVTEPGKETPDIFFEEGGGMVYMHEGRWYFRAEKPGAYTVTAHAVSKRLLAARKSTRIRVRAGEKSSR